IPSSKSGLYPYRKRYPTVEKKIQYRPYCLLTGGLSYIKINQIIEEKINGAAAFCHFRFHQSGNDRRGCSWFQVSSSGPENIVASFIRDD
ncbi:MAG: hypothetical protein P8X55_20550, partial [Desulfosarcinaceae bacterium]